MIEIGDVVQITGKFKKRDSVVIHPLYGMIGTIIGRPKEDDYEVYLLQEPLYKSDLGLRYFIFLCAPNEITRIGKAAWIPNIQELTQKHELLRLTFDQNPMLERLEHGDKWKHVEPGTPESRERGCKCEDIRNTVDQE
jgi:hypothetical protein